MERDCVRMLRTHVEILEGLHLASHPVPSSLTEYKKFLAERKQQLCENEDILRERPILNGQLQWKKNLKMQFVIK